MKKILIIIASVLLVVATTMTVLFIRANHSKNIFINTSKSCITSFVNSVDYTLCILDSELGNIKLEKCAEYGDGVVDDMKYVRSLGYETNYQFIGE